MNHEDMLCLGISLKNPHCHSRSRGFVLWELTTLDMNIQTKFSITFFNISHRELSDQNLPSNQCEWVFDSERKLVR